jgi:hypothetical protein
MVSVVIPLYKVQPDEYELISLNQAIKILCSYDFSIVCPESLDTSFYENLFVSHSINCTIQRFENKCFKDLNSYSSLMLDIRFYERFRNYQYILIYQLDAYVFRGELKYWCSLGYDYIGAPWNVGFPVVPEGQLTFEKVGNGGLSLRKVQAFIDRLNYRFPLKPAKELRKEFDCFSKWQMILRYPIYWLKILGYKNMISYYVKKNVHFEDIFWCLFIETTRIPLKIPNVKLASKFSMEMGAEQLYNENGKELPFGCHAWLKHNYEFWKEFIN